LIGRVAADELGEFLLQLLLDVGEDGLGRAR
jgi:hypothetical protein